MTRHVINAFASVGFNVSIKKCQWMSTSNNVEYEEVIMNGVSVAQVQVMTVLGSNNSVDGCLNAEVEHRVKQAWSYFWAHCDLIFNKHASLVSRLGLWNKIVCRPAFWAVETLDLPEKQMKLLDTMQTEIVATMMKLRRRWSCGENWLGYLKRRFDCTRYMIETWSHGYLSHQYLFKFFNWCGHVARFPEGRWAKMTTTWMSNDGREEEVMMMQKHQCMRFSEDGEPGQWQTVRA